MARQYRDMTGDEREHYARLCGEATGTITEPCGAHFVLLLFDLAGRMDYVANIDRSNVPTILREIADKIETIPQPSSN